MEKVIKFIKKHYILFTIIGALVFVMLASLLIITLIKNSKNKIIVSSSEVTAYEYVDTKKEEFTATLSYENNKIASINADGFNIYANGIIYVNEMKSLIIPKDSMIVFYYQDNLTYKLNKYSELLYSKGSNIVISEGQKIISDNFFIYDGEDTYILPNDFTLIVNDETIFLSGNSYIIASYDSLIYYDYESDQIKKVSNIQNASINMNNIAIDLLKDVTVYNNKVNLLTNNINNIDIYKED